MTMFGAALHISMIAICLLSAAYLYLYLIPSIGAGINNKCLGSMRCSRYLELVQVGGVDTAFAYRVDGADRQWRGFRSALGLLIVVSASVSGALSLIRRKMLAGLRDEVRWVLALRLVVGAVIVIVYHGYHALIVFTIALMGYLVSSLSLHDQSRQVMYTWVFAVVVMLFKESYRLRDRCPLLVPLFDSRRYGGMYEWQYPANFLVLRMVSFSLDRCWATYGRRSSSSSQEGSQSSLLLHSGSCSRSTSTSSSEEAESASLDMQDYGLLQYLSYALYSPLYIAGPVCSFNAYMTYSRHPQLQERVAAYAVRWVACCLLMEFLTSQFFFFAVISAHMTHLLDPFEVAVLCYVTLKLMWLKFLIIWRAFRLWALLDGVNSPENMLKCMSNNHSLEQFWRGWHSSFNRWIVRYLYRPLGGRVRNNVFNATIVFLFVSAWHDIEPKLLAWGLLNAAFYALEVTAKRWYSALQEEAQGAIPSAVHHFVTITAGALYIIVLIGVNLVGYSVGIDGASAMLGRFYSTDGCRALCCSFYFLCIGVILMRYIEEGYKQQQQQQTLKVE